jgi:hypothetical protein
MNEKDIIEIRMYHPEEESTGNYEVVKVGENEYKLAANDPFNEDFSYGTIIEVEKEEKDKGVLQFKRISKKSDFTLNVYGLGSSLNETELRIVGDMIIKEGGYWEVIFGGIAYVNLPKESRLKVIEELNKLIEKKKRKTQIPHKIY